MVFSNFFQGLDDAFSVSRPVSSSTGFGSDEDTLKTTNALKGLGHMGGNSTDIGSGLKSFQSENGLKVDGIMNPGGPTENALSQTLAQNGIGNSDLFAKSGAPNNLNIKITKPISSKPDTQSFTASASFDPSSPPKKPKLDPLTGQPDPLAKSPIPKKSKAEMDKLWEQVGELNKSKTAVMPKGDSVDERIRSIMADPRYLLKKEQPIVDHVVRQFERAYPGETQYDETGKMIQPKPVIKPDEVEPFDPNGEFRPLSDSDEKANQEEPDNNCSALKSDMDQAYQDWEDAEAEYQGQQDTFQGQVDIADDAWNDFEDTLYGIGVPSDEIPEKPDHEDKDKPKKNPFSWGFFKKLLERVLTAYEVGKYLNDVADAYWKYNGELENLEDLREKVASAQEFSRDEWRRYQSLKDEYEQNCGK